MTGVEILNSTEVVVDTALNWTVFWIVAGVLLGVLTTISVIWVIRDTHHWKIILDYIVLGLIAGIICGYGIGMMFGKPSAWETHYKVTIDDSVSMNEFLDKYEILDQEGKIYTVKEK